MLLKKKEVIHTRNCDNLTSDKNKYAKKRERKKRKKKK